MSVADDKPDLSEFLALSSKHPDACIIARSLARLGAKDRVNLLEALNRKDDDGRFVVSESAIATWLRSKELGGRAQAVKKHRNESCLCA